jgi:D-glycero-D-manno-heptose 1,7-bisphosphate phosphatase
MLIILDRDGVINEDSDAYIKTPAEWIPIAGSLDAIAALNRAGHTVVIATNQSGVGRGLYTEADLAEIHQRMQRELAAVGGHIDAIFYCPHHPDDHCVCRKPKPGLLHRIAEKLNTNFAEALMVGDALRDIECAKAVGCPAVLVKTGKGIQTLNAQKENWDVPVYDNLAAVVAMITQQIKKN